MPPSLHEATDRARAAPAPGPEPAELAGSSPLADLLVAGWLVALALAVSHEAAAAYDLLSAPPVDRPISRPPSDGPDPRRP